MDFFGIDSGTSLGKLVFDSPKETMTVWRVQRCNAKASSARRCLGPFNLHASDLYPEDKGKPRELRTTHKVGLLVNKLMLSTENTPAPEDDFKGDMFDFSKRRVRQKSDPVLDGPHYFFGFVKPEDAEAWFGKRVLDALAKYQFTVQPVPAKRVWLSKTKKQVIFVPAE